MVQGLAGDSLLSMLSDNKWCILKAIPHPFLTQEGQAQPHAGSGARALALCLTGATGKEVH